EAGVRDIFQRHGLIPPVLLAEAQSELAGFPSAEALAIAFAACAFPQRAYQMRRGVIDPAQEFLCEDELPCRMRQFRQMVAALSDKDTEFGVTDVEGLVPLVGLAGEPHDLAQIVVAIGAADPPSDPGERAGRMAGTALHLLTCTPAALARMRD